MAYENSAGIGVSNQYGPRQSGGEEGVFKTFGEEGQFVVDLSAPRPFNVKFPVRNNVWVYAVDLTFAVGTVSAVAIGGVAVQGATSTAPVHIPQGNTGVVTQTGGTGGKIVIKYRNVAKDDYPLV